MKVKHFPLIAMVEEAYKYFLDIRKLEVFVCLTLLGILSAIIGGMALPTTISKPYSKVPVSGDRPPPDLLIMLLA